MKTQCNTCAGFYVDRDVSYAPAYGRESIKRYCHLSVRLSACLSVCPMSLAQQQCRWAMHRAQIGNPMLQVEPTGQRGRIWPPEVARTTTKPSPAPFPKHSPCCCTSICPRPVYNRYWRGISFGFAIAYTFRWLFIHAAKTGSIDVVKDCQNYFAIDLPSSVLKTRQDKFIVRYKSTVNNFCKFCITL